MAHNEKELHLINSITTATMAEKMKAFRERLTLLSLHMWLICEGIRVGLKQNFINFKLKSLHSGIQMYI